ncbi:DNA polymerase III subunit epsilon [Corynebacterium minutissimum]
MTTTPSPTEPTAQQSAEAAAAVTSPSTGAPKPGPRPKHTKDTAREEALAAFPYVALTIQTTGIHPSTGRLLTVDALTLNDSGDVGQEFHAVINPDGDPGPRHLHGLSPEEIKAGQAFSSLLKPLDRLIDGRTLIVHDTTYTWGFIVAEARRAMTAAARQNRARNRNRNKGRRRRVKVGHVPAPISIIDTLATARRQGVWGTDIRLAAVARDTGLDAPSPKATVERAQRTEKDTSREATRLLVELYRAQREGTLSTASPEDLRADRFGLQRSHVRVDAAEAARQHHNPGPYVPGKELIRGMEIVVAPEITEDPDTIIAALTREELNYSEKLTRETSLVVCNITTDLVGKPMHAHRKDIPLMSDTAFLAALERIEDAQEPEETDKTSGSSAGNGGNHGNHGGGSGGQNNRNRSSHNKNRRRSRRKSSHHGQGSKNNANQGQNHKNTQDDSGNNGSPNKNNAKGGSNKGSNNNGRRRRRRGGRGRRGNGNQHQQNQQNSGHNRSRTTDN